MLSEEIEVISDFESEKFTKKKMKLAKKKKKKYRISYQLPKCPGCHVLNRFDRNPLNFISPIVTFDENDRPHNNNSVEENSFTCTNCATAFKVEDIIFEEQYQILDKQSYYKRTFKSSYHRPAHLHERIKLHEIQDPKIRREDLEIIETHFHNFWGPGEKTRKITKFIEKNGANDVPKFKITKSNIQQLLKESFFFFLI